MARDPFEPLRVRGVTREDVIRARGYEPYYGALCTEHDPQAIDSILDTYTTMSRRQRAQLRKWMVDARDDTYDATVTRRRVSDSGAVVSEWDGTKHDRGHGDGLVMHKHPFPGEPEILPQLRPRDAVVTGVEGHTHERYERLVGSEKFAEHLDEAHSLGIVPAPDEWHWHEKTAKYMFPPQDLEKVFHDHATSARFQGPRGAQMLRRHLRSKHKKRAATGEHWHWRKKRDAVGNRLDVNPLSLERMKSAPVIFFGLEGALKADAMLSQILERDLPAAVLDVPSVTLWTAPELERVAKTYLTWPRENDRPPLVVLVCDADWASNEAVRNHALECREKLRRLHVDAYVAGPPPCDLEGIHADCEQGKKCKRNGVDDFIAAGGLLEGLVVLDAEADDSPVKLLALRAAKDDGRVSGSIRVLGKLLECSRTARAVKARLEELIAGGYLTSNRELVLAEDEFNGGLTWAGKPHERPVFTIRADLRKDETPKPLADFLSRRVGTSRAERVRVRAEALWLEERETTGTPRFLLERHITAAVREIAEADGITYRELSEHPETVGLRSFARSGRDWMLSWDQRSSTDPGLLADYRVSASTVRRARRQAFERKLARLNRNDPTGKTTDHAEEATMSTTTASDLVVRMDAMQERLDEILRLTAETCERLREKYPNSTEIGAAVDTFIASVR